MPSIVKHIHYKGEEWPIRISYYSIKMFQHETGKDIQDLDKDISLLEVLLWFGLIAGHMAESKPMILKREEMEFMLDESMTEFNEIIMSFFPLATDTSNTDKKK